MTSHEIADISKGKRNNTIQLFRGLAIIAVVMIHTTPLGLCQLFGRPLINFSVATFLFLSGLLTKTECSNWLTFYKKRIMRVLIPYIIWSAIYSLKKIMTDGVGIFFHNLLTAEAAAPLYFIPVYIQFVLLTPLLGRLGRSPLHAAGWFIMPFTVICFKYAVDLFGVTIPYTLNVAYDCSCLGWFSFYYLGLLLGNNILQRNYSLERLFILYALTIALQLFETWMWYSAGDENCGTQMKLTTMFSSAVFCLIIYTVIENGGLNIKNSNLLVSIGDFSFGIYLCHIMVLHMLGHFALYRDAPYPLNSAGVLLISFACCYFGSRMLGTKGSRYLGLE